MIGVVAPETYLQIVQSVVSRLASQSTTVKGWCITITAGLLGFALSTEEPAIAALAIYVVLAFAVLDGYYLALERSYRALFRDTAATPSGQWTLDVERPGVRGVAAALTSPSILIFYPTSLLATIGTGAYLLAG